ncbi:MAG: hypothetical protein ALECFALPRED_005407 [Alectoria fallacina]|uniref:Uncharacterized protein n=1 Tax=Alectoria fallacina TaxID=1903189 RepID=A0A8H3ES02_9LECA|nr:MAG: hypothetical protein ALECFALPRED_005407 [Alectoria fallacina]
MFASAILGALFLSLVAAVSVSVNRTASSSRLHTWWHSTGEYNSQTSVLDGNVRQSGHYSVQVSTSSNTSDPSSYYDSFVYETIPRNGMGNIIKPLEPAILSTNDDGISIESAIGMTMAWTSFLYSEDVSIRITRLDGGSTAAGNVIIHPTTLEYAKTEVNGDIYITVPYSKRGVRFSVEFTDNLYEFHSNCAISCTVGGLVQNSNPSGESYWQEPFDSRNPVVGIEPLNSLLIFASPFPPPDMVPNPTSPTSFVVEPGLVTDVNTTDKNTVPFNPGVYWFSSVAHAALSSSVDWVDFAPGAYVKGAISFSTIAPTMKATGHGVLSGEQYVYQANIEAGYCNDQSNQNDLRMWSGVSSNDQQTFILNGVTINAPPFNSMDFTGNLATLSLQVSDYKQVGAFFGQTDGLENYPGSTVQDVFYHSNDDTIKTYYSNVTIERVTVWKGTTAPTVQFGWASRTLENILVTDVDIIHSRYPSNSSHPSLVGLNQLYSQPDETDPYTANVDNYVRNVTFSNFRSEGISGGLFRICPLETFDSFLMDSFWIEDFSPAVTAIEQSELPQFFDATSKEPVGISGFVVKDFTVFANKTAVTQEAGNWDIGSLGSMNIAPEYNVTIV